MTSVPSSDTPVVRFTALLRHASPSSALSRLIPRPAPLPFWASHRLRPPLPRRSQSSLLPQPPLLVRLSVFISPSSARASHLSMSTVEQSCLFDLIPFPAPFLPRPTFPRQPQSPSAFPSQFPPLPAPALITLLRFS